MFTKTNQPNLLVEEARDADARLPFARLGVDQSIIDWTFCRSLLSSVLVDTIPPRRQTYALRESQLYVQDPTL